MSAALGGARTATIPAYVSGLPKATLPERVALAGQWRARGFRGIKYAGVVAREGVAEEMHALRAALPPDTDLMVDLHWRYTADEALALARVLADARPYFIEAPCAPEDVAGLERVAAEAGLPVAAGEEWRNVYEAQLRLDRARLAYVQPEMAHTGVSQFVAIAALAAAKGVATIPHATIGVGIFMAASLHAVRDASTAVRTTSTSTRCSIATCSTSTPRCIARRASTISRTGPGHGVTPRPELWQHVVRG